MKNFFLFLFLFFTLQGSLFGEEVVGTLTLKPGESKKLTINDDTATLIGWRMVLNDILLAEKAKECPVEGCAEIRTLGDKSVLVAASQFGSMGERLEGVREYAFKNNAPFPLTAEIVTAKGFK